MANDLTLTQDNVIVNPSWTKLVSKAGDIVRNQKATMKTNAVVQMSPTQKDKLDSLLGFLDNNLTNNQEGFNKGNSISLVLLFLLFNYLSLILSI